MFDSDYSLAELILCGFSGTSIRADSERYFRREKYSNFILFSQNFESGSQLSELTAQVQALVLSHHPSTSALIGVDQEGGRVQRFHQIILALVKQSTPSIVSGNCAQTQKRK